MKRLPVIIGLVSVALFVTTASYINRYMKSLVPSAPVVVKQPVAAVVVATGELPLGTRLERTHLRTIDWPADAVPAGAQSDPAAIVGALTLSKLVANEPVLADKVADRGGFHTLMALKIPEGMRAVSVRVNDVTGISGFVAPGTRVDVIAIISAKDVGGGQGAFTLLQDIEVLASAQEMDNRAAEPTVVNTVTLLVTPAQAERLALANNSGTLQLALRGYDDRAAGKTSGVSVAQIAFTPRAKEKKADTVELIRGKERVVHAF
jgi:pilus assembly protein CpaB